VGTVGAIFTLTVLAIIAAILVSGLTRVQLGALLLRLSRGEFLPAMPDLSRWIERDGDENGRNPVLNERL
jgi:hypothetical protein